MGASNNDVGIEGPILYTSNFIVIFYKVSPGGDPSGEGATYPSPLNILILRPEIKLFTDEEP